MDWFALGERLTTTRQRLNLSCSELGRLVGVSHVTVINWESGKRIYLDNWDNLVVALKKLDTDFDENWLKYGDDPVMTDMDKVAEPQRPYAVASSQRMSKQQAEALNLIQNLNTKQLKGLINLLEARIDETKS